MASGKIKDPSIYAGPPSKIITVGSIVHSRWICDYDENNRTIPGTNRQVNVFGSEIRLYTTRLRQRDGARILTKLGVIESFIFKYDPLKDKKPKRGVNKERKTKKQAVHIAKGLAEKYDWFYIAKAAHNDRVSDSLQAYLELEELENR